MATKKVKDTDEKNVSSSFMSLEDAVAAVEDQDNKLGISNTPKQVETPVLAPQTIPAKSASFDPKMFDADDMATEEKKAPISDIKSAQKADEKSTQKASASKDEKAKSADKKSGSDKASKSKEKDVKSNNKLAEKDASVSTDSDDQKSEENAELDKKEAKSKKMKEKLSPEKNFKLLKALVIILSILVTAVSAYVYVFQIYDLSTPFTYEKLIPMIPFICQVLLLLITLLTVGTSQRKPIGSAIKENMQNRQEEKEKEIDAQVTKEISDNLLVPEINLTPKKNVELSNFQIDNFYKKSIEEINGKYYMQVAKFDDSVKAFSSLGATDMELCAVNMVGSAKFDEILDQQRTKTLNSNDLATYCMSKPQVFTIKKRGSMDWTFKYNSKSFAIIREGEGSYKASIKCYPDAATRINDVYMALEDSNFPSGPLWYCFNELRNLPPRVCKYLIDTSCQISQFQQTKTDKLKDNIKKAKDYDINMQDIGQKFKAGQKVIAFPKFTMIFTKGTDADLTTFLTRAVDGVDASQFTKEYYYKFLNSDNAVSILCPTKGVSEDVIIAIFDEIEKACK